MKIHVPSMLAIGVDKHTQAATMASLNIRAATLASKNMASKNNNQLSHHMYVCNAM